VAVIARLVATCAVAVEIVALIEAEKLQVTFRLGDEVEIVPSIAASNSRIPTPTGAERLGW
jgi:hypothetical protein